MFALALIVFEIFIFKIYDEYEGQNQGEEKLNSSHSTGSVRETIILLNANGLRNRQQSILAEFVSKNVAHILRLLHVQFEIDGIADVEDFMRWSIDFKWVL